MSPRKVRIVANMIRGKRVEDALGVLTLLPKKSAKIIAKLLNSAVANADDLSKGKADVDALTIKTIQVDNGPLIKRWMPRAMGRANRINHRTSHITVVLDEGGAQ
jgi:large subunit ribosomal protein L22